MRARTLAYAVCAAAPFWSLAYLAIQGRFANSTWVPLEYGPKVERDILAYQAPVRKTQQLLQNEVGYNQAELEEIAQEWIRHSRAGILNPIPSIIRGDSGTTGVRQQIESSRNRLLIALRRSGRLAEGAGHIDLAVDRYLMALEIAEIGKFSSLTTAQNAQEHQRYVVERFRALAPRMSLDSASRVASQIQSLRANEQTLARVVARTLDDEKMTTALEALTNHTKSDTRLVDLFPTAEWQAIRSGDKMIVGLSRNVIVGERKWATELTAAQIQFGGQVIVKAEKPESWTLASWR